MTDSVESSAVPDHRPEAEEHSEAASSPSRRAPVPEPPEPSPPEPSPPVDEALQSARRRRREAEEAARIRLARLSAEREALERATRERLLELVGDSVEPAALDAATNQSVRLRVIEELSRQHAAAAQADRWAQEVQRLKARTTPRSRLNGDRASSMPDTPAPSADPKAVEAALRRAEERLARARARNGSTGDSATDDEPRRKAGADDHSKPTVPGGSSETETPARTEADRHRAELVARAEKRMLQNEIERRRRAQAEPTRPPVQPLERSEATVAPPTMSSEVADGPTAQPNDRRSLAPPRSRVGDSRQATTSPYAIRRVVEPQFHQVDEERLPWRNLLLIGLGILVLVSLVAFVLLSQGLLGGGV